jgi:type VI secretion system protein ImpC
VTKDLPTPAELTSRIVALIADIDRELTRLLNVILHLDRFQSLEATWRGLHYLVHRSGTAANVRIRLLDVAKGELSKSLRKCPLNDSMTTGGPFDKLYDDAYRASDSEPFGCLIGDYWFDHTSLDHELLTQIARLAAIWQAPFFAGAAAALLGIASWREVNCVDVDAKFAGPEYQRWRSLRHSDDSRFVGLIVPPMLARKAFVATGIPVGDYAFHEEAGSDAHACWTNPVYALALQWIRAFDKYGWCGAMEAIETDTDPEFPPVTFPSCEAGERVDGPLAVAISDEAFVGLRRQGLIPLLHHHSTQQPCWPAVPSLHQPTVYESDEATRAALLGVQMRYVLSATRFAHYLTLIARDSNGRLFAQSEIEQRLTRWLQSYVNLEPQVATLEASALRPLAEGRRVQVQCVQASNHCTARLMVRPQFQMPEATLIVLQVLLTGRT